jgi:hypothetical protein
MTISPPDNPYEETKIGIILAGLTTNITNFLYEACTIIIILSTKDNVHSHL